MLDRVREFFHTRHGFAVTCVLAGLAVVLGATAVWNGVGESSLAADARHRVFICAETGKTFNYTLRAGDEFPVLSPHSGRRTGYQAEPCYWTADGHAKAKPTWVLLNAHKGVKGPTFCPDCGRLVVAFNPAPLQGAAPPPTREEFARAKARSVQPDVGDEGELESAED